MAQALNRLVGDSSVLILIPDGNDGYDMVVRSANNLPEAKTLLANYLNIRDLLGYDKLLMPLKSLDVLVSFLG
jgi:large subunit ribosomal protein L4